MLKRFMSLMCALIMACSCGVVTGAMAEEEQQLTASLIPSNLFAADGDSGSYYYVTNMVVAGNTIYAVADTDDGEVLCYWRSGMERYACADMHEYVLDGETKTMTRMVFADQFYDAATLENLMDSNGDPVDGSHAVGTLFTDGNRLMTVNPHTGLVFEIVVDESGAVTYNDIVTLQDTTPLFHEYGDGDRYAVNMRSVTAADGKLYFVPNDWSSTGYQKSELYIADLTTGEVKLSAVKYVTALTRYKDGKLALRICDEENSYDEETGTNDYGTVSIYDPATDTAQEFAKLSTSVNNMYYSDALDVLFYQDSTRLIGFVNGQEKQVGYVPISYTSYAAIVGQTFIACSGSETVTCELNLNFNTGKHLTIGNLGYMDDGAKLFAARYPDIPVYYDNEYYSDMESIGQAMVNGDNAVDIFVMSMSYGSFTNLMKKGYCADLSSYSAITDYTSRMYSVFTDAVTLNGKLYAIPKEAYGTGWFYTKDVMEAVGLTVDDLPTNYVDLCEFITRWNDEYADEYPEYWLLDSMTTGLKNTMLTYLMQEYINWCTSQGKDLTFDTAEFRTLMKAWEGIECDRIDKMMADDMANDSYHSSLFSSSYTTIGDFGWLSGQSSNYEVYLPMTLTADTDASFATNLTVMFINPNTSNMEAAIDFIACELEGMNDVYKHILYTDETEPVRNSYYDRMVSSETEYLESLKKQLEEADDADKSWIQESIDSEEDYITNTLANYEFEISLDAIQKYQADVVGKIFIIKPTFTASTSSNATSELTSLISRYRDGQITLDQFVREMDNKMRMMRMEDE